MGGGCKWVPGSGSQAYPSFQASPGAQPDLLPDLFYLLTLFFSDVSLRVKDLAFANLPGTYYLILSHQGPF